MTEWRKISQRGSKEIYYTDLKVSSEIFANEWDKQILLNSLERLRKLFDFELYAFCVLNDRIRLLIGGTRLKASAVRHMLATLLERYDCRTDQIGEYDLLPPGMMARVCVTRIECEQDAIDVLRYIHLTPSSEGYSLTAGDYWWIFAHFGRFFCIFTRCNMRKILEIRHFLHLVKIYDFFLLCTHWVQTVHTHFDGCIQIHSLDVLMPKSKAPTCKMTTSGAKYTLEGPYLFPQGVPLSAWY